jgi:hypothetical protein
MRVCVHAALFVLVLGCGKLLGFDEDADNERTSAPAPATDGSADASADALTADGTNGADATRDGALPYSWSCAVDPMTLPYADSMTCDQARLETACRTDLAPPANGDPCPPPEPGTLSEPDHYCDTCMKVQGGGYNFAVTRCTCIRQ